MRIVQFTHESRPRSIQAHRGFTLIELMIVVVIIGILASIAYPAYQEQVRKTKRSDGKSALTELANRQEKYYSQCFTYTNSFTNAFPTGSNCAGTGLGYTATTTPEGQYTLAIPAASATAYTLTATAVAGTSQANDTGCTTLSLLSTGAKTPTQCW
jgi:type IV pilus assembly protein PilE